MVHKGSDPMVDEKGKRYQKWFKTFTTIKARASFTKIDASGVASVGLADRKFQTILWGIDDF
jgi:hypothetical protein